MAKVCDVTGVRAQRGNKVSHSNRKTRKFQQPNLHRKRVWSPEKGRWITLRLTTRALRTIDKRGVDAVLAQAAARASNRSKRT